jgi:hypothetical protein
MGQAASSLSSLLRSGVTEAQLLRYVQHGLMVAAS